MVDASDNPPTTIEPDVETTSVTATLDDSSKTDSEKECKPFLLSDQLFGYIKSGADNPEYISEELQNIDSKDLYIRGLEIIYFSWIKVSLQEMQNNGLSMFDLTYSDIESLKEIFNNVHDNFLDPYMVKTFFPLVIQDTTIWLHRRCLVCKRSGVVETGEKQHICPQCKQTYVMELQRVRANLLRAEQNRREATLTITEWLSTLRYHHFRCAYCDGPYEVLEHYIPLIQGGGTTQENCMPSCIPCNNKKGKERPKH